MFKMAPIEERGIMIIGTGRHTDEFEKALATLTATGGYTISDYPAPTMSMTPTFPTFDGVHELYNSRSSLLGDDKTPWGRMEKRRLAKECKSANKSAVTCMKNRAKRKKKKR